jgi:hypothetical protein
MLLWIPHSRLAATLAESKARAKTCGRARQTAPAPRLLWKQKETETAKKFAARAVTRGAASLWNR